MFVIKISSVKRIIFQHQIPIKTFLVLLLIPLMAQLAFADIKQLEKFGSVYRFPLSVLEQQNTDPQKMPPWIVEIKKESEWIPHYLENISPNRLCMSIQFYNPDAAFVHIGNDKYQPGVNSGEPVNCWNRESHTQLPAFQLIVEVNPSLSNILLFENQRYTTRINVEVDVSDPQTRVSTYKWTLQAQLINREWKTIGGLNISGFSQSRWIQDPIDKGHYALLLVGEASGKGAQVPETGSAPSVLSLKGLQPGTGGVVRAKSAAPIINFKNSQTASKLMLEVLPDISRPSEGWYCIRAIYKDKEQYLSFANVGNKWVTAQSISPGNHDVVACSAGDSLTFPVYLRLNPASVEQEFARLYVSQLSKDNIFDMSSDAIIALRSGETSAGSLLAKLSDESSDVASGWTSIRGRPALFLVGSNIDVSTSVGNSVNQVPVTLRYGGHGEPPDDVLLVDGVNWRSWDDPRILVEPMEIQWDSSKAHPISIQLCRDTECDASGVIATLDNSSNPFQLSLNQFVGAEKAYVIIDWGPALPSDQSADSKKIATVSSDVAATQTTFAGITFAPFVKYGQYSRPLTACLGRLISKTQTGPMFSLKLGKQVMDSGGWPTDLGPDDMVKVVFDEARGGGECPVQGLESQQYVVSSLMQLAENGPVEIEIEVLESLFVGYFQLNGADYRSTLIRWREVIELLSRTYEHGRASGIWVDGLVFSAGEKGGVYPTIEPDSNFVSTLSDDASLLNIAQSLESTTRVSSDLFAEQLLSLKEIVGQTPVSLMYFDDFLSACGNYEQDLASSGLNIKEAIVVAAIDGYTGNDDSVRSLGGGLAHVCEDSNSSNVTVYAFNWKEQLGNLAWGKTFNTIYDDLLQRWK